MPLQQLIFTTFSPMELSVIIVNYNVTHFLEQCLLSVVNAIKGVDAEIYVVDNASSDNSCPMVRQRFPNVKLIENKKNVGFSKANNQAIALASGKYVLLLNPDTVVQEDTLSKCIAFMDSTPDAGGTTVKMINGRGKYLPESKRGFPTPWVSFFKIFGITALFPKSKTFARYYLGHLDKNSTHEIDVLPGAFMFIRKEALTKTGLLDEQFFMYGEDIDLSYRFTQAGYKNYYFPECQIIHYKGESTKKGSLNYVVVFYKAMLLFTKKHFKSGRARRLILLINMAIYFRAFLSIIKRVVEHIWLPIIDISIITLGITAILPRWEQFRFQDTGIYPRPYVALLLTFYLVTWWFSLWINGAYDKPQKTFASSKGVLTGTLIILAVYSILPNEMRFSRAIIIFTSIWTLVTTQLIRIILAKFYPKLMVRNNYAKRIAIIGNLPEAERVKSILDNSGISYSYTGNFMPYISKNPETFSNERLEEFVRVNNVDEIIFCTQNISIQNIVSSMLLLSSLGKEYKIAPYEGTFIIGSNSVEATGELYSPDVKTIGAQASKRTKRLFDMAFSLLIIATSPVSWIFLKKPIKVWVNAVKVFTGIKTWVGYSSSEISTHKALPRIKPCVFPYASIIPTKNTSELDLNIFYAKSYSASLDFTVLWKNLTGNLPR